MPSLSVNPTRGPAGFRNRPGAALFLTVLLTTALALTAMSAIFLSSNATLQSRSFSRERDFRYAAEAAIAMGKSRLNTDADALPDTGYAALITDQPIIATDGSPIPGARVNLYVGRTGSLTGQFGQFASVVAEVRDANGARFVRRLELNEESFAKFAYWSNREKTGSSTIWFGGGDNLWGPVWSNDTIHIAASRATFHDVIGTAKTIDGLSNGTYKKGYSLNQKPIALPDLSRLGKLAAYASLGGLSFAAPNSLNETGVLMRIEFVAVDLNGDGDSTDGDEGFIRVYRATAGNTAWLRGDYPAAGTAATAHNCGDWHMSGGRLQFFPAAIHNTAWFRTKMQVAGGGTMTSGQATTESGLSLSSILKHPNARCFPGGDPHLVASERNTASFTNAQKQIAGSDTTFTPVGRFGAWQAWTGPVDPRVTAARRDAAYLFPIGKALNTGSKGVIHVAGTVAVSGTVRGRLTLYSEGTMVIVDDIRYATDPASGDCLDMLGLVSAKDIVVADNAILTPVSTGGGTYTNVDDSKDLYIHAVLMAVNTSFRVQNNNTGPTNANKCEAFWAGRGCIYLTGGIIQESRGPVGTLLGHGFSKRYSYDRCAVTFPPPYFPTTGRFDDNRYYEVDPVRFDVKELYERLTPG